MTELLEQATLQAQSLPPEMQDEIARIVFTYAGDDGLVGVTPDEDTELAGSEAAAARGDFAADDEVRAIWAKHGL